SDLTPIWDAGIRGQGQIAAVADTGVHVDSCYFEGAGKIVAYQNFASDNDGDRNGHGTHVAGSVLGDRGGDGVATGEDGMAPASRLVAQDVGSGSRLDGIDEDMAVLLAPAYESGARVHNNSWGSNQDDYTAIARSVDAYVFDQPDMLVVFANGNSGSSPGSVGSPATAKNVISVGATLNGSNARSMASFSSHGPASDGRIKPTLSAPGATNGIFFGGIRSARSGRSCSTRALQGTSMASPITAGAAVLVRQYFMDGFYPSGVATAADGFIPSSALLKAVLISGAQDMSGSRTGGAIPSNGQGFGRVNLDGSLHLDGDTQGLFVSDSESLDQGEVWSVTLSTDEVSDIKVVLTWIDPPGEAMSDRALVNDLDLRVEGAAGVYVGNAMRNGVSFIGGEGDAVNVEELVVLQDAPAGEYIVSVAAANVPMGPQRFAVAATGAF
ncbi:MAG: S8 family serine peptidase, partial [Myxococcota bacterium]